MKCLNIKIGKRDMLISEDKLRYIQGTLLSDGMLDGSDLKLLDAILSYFVTQVLGSENILKDKEQPSLIDKIEDEKSAVSERALAVYKAHIQDLTEKLDRVTEEAVKTEELLNVRNGELMVAERKIFALREYLGNALIDEEKTYVKLGEDGEVESVTAVIPELERMTERLNVAERALSGKEKQLHLYKTERQDFQKRLSQLRAQLQTTPDKQLEVLHRYRVATEELLCKCPAWVDEMYKLIMAKLEKDK